MTDLITTEVTDRVLIVRLNRPGKRNALTREMYGAMASALRRADEDGTIRVTLITGSGDSFTAGNDLSEFVDREPFDPSGPLFQFLEAISEARRPVVAAVNGVAVGIGTTLLLHCDLVYAADTARFSLPFVHLGLVPEAASSLLLPRLAGHQRSAEFLLLGKPFGPEEARDIGIVNRVCRQEDVFEVAREAARELAAKPRDALVATKALMKRQGESTADRIAVELREFSERLSSPEAKEAITAFLERRPPDFSRLNA